MDKRLGGRYALILSGGTPGCALLGTFLARMLKIESAYESCALQANDCARKI